MALSGTLTQNVGSYWRLRLVWTATQNIANNTSTITSKLYWEAISSNYGAIYSTQSKSGNHVIDGTSSSFSATAGLNNGQSKLIDTHSKTVTHNSNGTKSVNLSGSFNVAITLGGTYVNSVSISGTANLNTIPRTSTVSSNANWTAGSDTTISIAKSSSSFRHELEIYVQHTDGLWRSPVKTLSYSTSESSKSTAFTTAENTEIFSRLNGGGSRSTRFILRTFNGTTEIGSTTLDGTVTAPIASMGVPENNNVSDMETVVVNVRRNNNSFTHTVQISAGTLTKTFTNVGTSVSWLPSSAERTSIRQQMANTNTLDGEVRVTTYYNGIAVRSPVVVDLDFYIDGANPVFGTSFTYYDNNSATTALTGDSSYIIQNQSNVMISIPTSAFATAQDGATMSRYEISLNGRIITVNQGTTNILVNFGVITAGTNQTLSIKAIDSRGKSTVRSKVVQVLAYTPPVVTTTVTRTNGFDETVRLTLSGSITPLTTGGGMMNSLRAIAGQPAPLQYRYRQEGTNTTFTSWSTFSYTTSGENYTASSITLTLNNTVGYVFEIRATDRLATTTVTKTVASGKPIFFIDSVKKSLGFNDYPLNNNEFRMNGRLVFGSNFWLTNYGGESDRAGVIDLNNSDIVRANGIYFNDAAASIGEGLLWLKPGFASGSLDINAYEQFRINNGSAYIDDKLVFTRNNYNYVVVNDSSISHDGTMLIQNIQASVTSSAATSFADVSFNTAFTTAPIWIVSTAINSNSTAYQTSIQNITRFGCRIYISHIHNTSFSANISVNIVACGRIA